MEKQTQRPNILFIMADQWRWDFIGYMGADFVRTPNLDRLAAQGKVFTHCFTNSPLCSPARIALASGLNSDRIGALDNTAYLPRSVPSYYQRLRDQGYEVGCVGKLDLAKYESYNGIRGQRPCTYTWGFTDPCECEGKMHAGSSPTPIGPYSHYLENRGLLKAFHEDYQDQRNARQARMAADSVLESADFEDSYIGRRAATWIRERTGEYPWHMFVSFVGPHDPFDPPREYAERCQAATVPEPVGDNVNNPDYVRHARRQYCAAIELIDDQVGAILQALEDSGQRDETYIAFSSDHGEMCGDLGRWTKSVPYDPSTRVPMLVAGPDIEPGRSDALISLFDLNPTMCAWAGLPHQENIDARNMPLLRDHDTAIREHCYISIRAYRAIRDHQVLFVKHNGGAEELYDMREDPHCQQNLAKTANPKFLRKLRGRLTDSTVEGRWCR